MAVFQYVPPTNAEPSLSSVIKYASRSLASQYFIDLNSRTFVSRIHAIFDIRILSRTSSLACVINVPFLHIFVRDSRFFTINRKKPRHVDEIQKLPRPSKES